MPQTLINKIHGDTKDLGIELAIIFSLPSSEVAARSFAEMMEWYYRGMPPASSGEYLSTIVK